METAKLRSNFPVLADRCYLNAGTDGPLPQQAVDAASQELLHAAEQGRTSEHFERRSQLSEQLRSGYASALGCEPAELALSTCTTEGLAIVIDGLSLGPGDEIVTSDEEHPGLLGALAVAKQVSGASVRIVPLAQVAAAVGPQTRLVACSHVSWMNGCLCPIDELAQLDVPVVLDGAQGVGAVPVDVKALGCAAYSGAGQKWLCGPDGLGMLYVSPALREQLAVRRRGYSNMVDPNEGLEASLHEDARRFDTLCLNAETLASGLAAWRVLEDAGLDAVHERARTLAQRLVELLEQAGRTVAPRAQTTLVSFSSDDATAERDRLKGLGVLLRDIPGTGMLRASVGAWNDEHDLQRLIDALAPV
ncbi:MAG TPA: aminotransferase class V-fold PLP-dependent enzyme [Solirubrobacteraceae bacterium]